MWDSKRDTDVKNSLLDSVGEGKGGMIWQNSIETCIIISETDRQSRFDAWDWVIKAGALGWPWGMGWGKPGKCYMQECLEAIDSVCLKIVRKRRKNKLGNLF